MKNLSYNYKLCVKVTWILYLVTSCLRLESAFTMLNLKDHRFGRVFVQQSRSHFLFRISYTVKACIHVDLYLLMQQRYLDCIYIVCLYSQVQA